MSEGGFHAPSEGLKQLLRNRGPDHLGQIQDGFPSCDDANGDGLGPLFGTSAYSLSFTSTVLALRGGLVEEQPFRDAHSGSVLCWNGEAWKIGNEPVEGNDGRAVFALLVNASSSHASTEEASAAVLHVLGNISGPFAFIFFDRPHGRLYAGRDRLGRRSLLYSTACHPGVMEFCSISDDDVTKGVWTELEADAIYVFSLSSMNAHSSDDQGDPLFSASLVPVRKHLWDVKSPIAVSFLREFLH